MTIREAIDMLRAVESKGTPSDDSRLSLRQTYNKLIRLRARLLSQKFRKKQSISQWDYQTIQCLPMDKAPLVECPCVPELGLYILKSRQPLPRVVLGFSAPIIQSITTLDGSMTFDMTSWEAMKNLKGNKYTSKNPRAFIRNNHLYTTNPRGAEIITTTGLFNDPLEVYALDSGCCEQNTADCISNLDRDFPVDSETMDTIAEMAKDELVVTFSQTKADTLSNSADDMTVLK